MSSEQLGDQKPSHLLRRLRNLANSNIQEGFIKELWLQRLPPNVKQILAISKDDLDNMAIMADQIMANSEASGVAAIKSNENKWETNDSATLQRLLIDTLKRLDVRDNRGSRGNSRRRDRTPSRSRPSSGNRQQADEITCYFHRKFGDKAHKCRSPCQFEKQKN